MKNGFWTLVIVAVIFYIIGAMYPQTYQAAIRAIT